MVTEAPLDTEGAARPGSARWGQGVRGLARQVALWPEPKLFAVLGALLGKLLASFVFAREFSPGTDVGRSWLRAGNANGNWTR